MNSMTTIQDKVACHTCPHKFRHLCRVVFAEEHTQSLRIQRRIRAFPAETRLQEENEPPKFTGILRRGYIRAERMLQNGNRTILNFLAPGDLVGNVLGMEREPALVAATDVEICAFDAAALRRATAGDDRIAVDLLAEGVAQHNRQLEMIWRRGALSSRERIIAFMIMATEFMPVEYLPDGGAVLTIRISRKDWADFANTTVETICRTLGDLSERGLVDQVQGGRYHIRDLAALARLAGLDSLRDRKAMTRADRGADPMGQDRVLTVTLRGEPRALVSRPLGRDVGASHRSVR